jgi:hypothetical protein
VNSNAGGDNDDLDLNGIFHVDVRVGCSLETQIVPVSVDAGETFELSRDFFGLKNFPACARLGIRGEVFMPLVINSFSLPELFLGWHHQWAC